MRLSSQLQEDSSSNCTIRNFFVKLKLPLDLKFAFCTDAKLTVHCTDRDMVWFISIYQSSCDRLELTRELLKSQPCRGYSQPCYTGLWSLELCYPKWCQLLLFLSKLGWQISEVLKIFHVFLSKSRLKEAGWLFSTIKPTDLSRIYFNNIITLSG